MIIILNNTDLKDRFKDKFNLNVNPIVFFSYKFLCRTYLSSDKYRIGTALSRIINYYCMKESIRNIVKY